MNTEIQELIGRQDELKSELRDIQHELCHKVMSFQGTLQEALRARIVKLNFAAPAGFYRMIRDQK